MMTVGYHLAYLHRRLAMQSVASLQTVALSATIDDAEDMMRFFNLKKSAFCYKQSVARKLQPCWVHIEDEERELTLFFDDLHRRSGCKKLLVFANSRKKCEQLYRYAESRGFFFSGKFFYITLIYLPKRESSSSLHLEIEKWEFALQQVLWSWGLILGM